MISPVVRRAAVEDAEAAARCHLACWREAYADLVDAAVLESQLGDLPGRTARWREMLGRGDDRWVAVVPTGEVVGFSAAGTGRDDDIDLPLELAAIYVRSAHWGTGLGDRLLTAAIGAEPAYLWVFEANLRARAFYARHGFWPDGSRKQDPWLDLPEVRLRRG